ncbi:YggT family protein [Pannonibacter carbonis]|uniref:YggT family protein n=1 Tax=Pannonibacter carbonis TaxID=2067569 RepID=UPI000D1089C1|nr:YggT family protein [Pannonibacter carbonis]
MRAILDVFLLVLQLYTYVLIASAIFSWLYAFNVVNSSNQFIATVGQILYNLTEPALRPIRRFIPSMNGLDLSPIVLLLGIFLLQNVIVRYIYPNVF